MANMTPKKQLTLAEKLAMLDKAADSINAKTGKVVCGRIGTNPEILEKLTIKFIPTPSPALNAAMGGGFPIGKTSIVSGNEDSGKTSLVLETIAKSMKENPDFIAGWLESEDSLEKDYICKTFGIDPERFFLVEHDIESGGEGALQKLEAIIGMGVLDLVCINSLKCLVPKSELDGDIIKDTIALQARLNAKMVRRFTGLVQENDTAFILISHLTTNIGQMHGDPLTLSGGRAIKYASMLTLDLRKQAIQESDPIARDEGLKIKATIRKNHCVPHRNPYVSAEYFIVFGEGIEQYLETLGVAIENGVLEKKGAWIRDIDPETMDPRVLPDGTVLKWQGKVAFKEYCKLNDAYFKEIQARIAGDYFENLTEEEVNAIEADSQKDAEVFNEIQEIIAQEEALVTEEPKEEKPAKKGKKK